MASARAWAIGVDLGGTKLNVAHVDESGKVGRQLRSPTDVQEGAVAIQSEIVTAIRNIWEEADSPPAGIGIGVAGQVDPRQGVVRFGPNLGWHDIPLQANVRRAFDLPVVVLNDVRAATWGEWLHGAGRGFGDLVCLFVGTGVGGGIVSGGQMLMGDNNTAAELGHLVVDMNGPACTCGNQGCLEALAGGWAIARRAREAISADPPGGAYLLAAAGGSEHISAEDVSRAAAEGDPFSLRVVAEVTRCLIAGSISIVNAFNPRRFILGGGVIRGMPGLVEQIKLGVKRHALAVATERLDFMRAELGTDAGVVGAASLAMRLFATVSHDTEDNPSLRKLHHVTPEGSGNGG